MDSAPESSTEVATRVMRDILRPDGRQVRIVAQTMFGAGLHPSADVYVLRRDSEAQRWHRCSDRPATNWREMPLEQYTREGRSEMLQTVSIGELLSVTSLLGRPLSEIARVSS
jgi:hypothetical protein